MYTPKRVLHGTASAVSHLQSSLAGIMPENLGADILCWLDDFLAQASTVDRLLNSLRSFFGLFAEYNIKLHLAKSTLFTTEVCCCERLISFEGLRYDPRRLGGLLSMVLPTTGAHLQQFICALQWVKLEI